VVGVVVVLVVIVGSEGGDGEDAREDESDDEHPKALNATAPTNRLDRNIHGWPTDAP
jgi:hypothetical protein